MLKQKWLITVSSGYGSFVFDGTEKEAEERRRTKANWEHAITRKRLLDDKEIETGVIDYCKNHPNYNTIRYHCECDKCILRKKQNERKRYENNKK